MTMQLADWTAVEAEVNGIIAENTEEPFNQSTIANVRDFMGFAPNIARSQQSGRDIGAPFVLVGAPHLRLKSRSLVIALSFIDFMTDTLTFAKSRMRPAPSSRRIWQPICLAALSGDMLPVFVTTRD